MLEKREKRERLDNFNIQPTKALSKAVFIIDPLPNFQRL